MPDRWMPGAEKYDVGSGNYSDTNTQYPPKAIAHITADKEASSSNPKPPVDFDDLVSYFRSNVNLCPHFLIDPFTGRTAQFFPADSRSMSLADADGGSRTNRDGEVVIQIEMQFFPYTEYKDKVYKTLRDTPGKGWEKIQDYCKSWGVPLKWPGGRPTSLVRDTMSSSTYQNAAGWIGHSQVPENNHVDPGSWWDFTDGGSDGGDNSSGDFRPYPGEQYFQVGSDNDYVIEVDENLIRLNFDHHHDGNGYQAGSYYSEYTKANVMDFQLNEGWTGSDADGLVGPTTWEKLHTNEP